MRLFFAPKYFSNSTHEICSVCVHVFLRSVAVQSQWFSPINYSFQIRNCLKLLQSVLFCHLGRDFHDIYWANRTRFSNIQIYSQLSTSNYQFQEFDPLLSSWTRFYFCLSSEMELNRSARHLLRNCYTTVRYSILPWAEPCGICRGSRALRHGILVIVNYI